MDAKAHVYATVPKDLGHFADAVLGLGHRHAVTGHNDHRLGVAQLLADIIGTGFVHRLIGIRGRRTAAGLAEATEDHADERAVHGLVHDVAEDGTAAAHQGTNDNQQIIAQHETDGSGGPPGVTVKHRNHHRHVGAANSHDQVNAEDRGNGGHQDQGNDPQCHALGAQEPGPEQDADNDRCQVHQVPSGQGQRLAVDSAVQFAAGHQ